MTTEVPLTELTTEQKRRVRALQVACLLFATTEWAVKIRVARWVMSGTWPT